jgi:inosine-uridine nucleoside N-ribohydrolase
LERAPDIAHKARFVGMHGSVRRGYGGDPEISPEWNVLADVESCEKVFAAPWEMTITPLDTCGLVTLDGDRYARVRDCPETIPAAIMANYRIWSQHHDKNNDVAQHSSSTLYDTVAVYLAIQQDYCRMERLGIRISEDGYTHLDEQAKPINVATEWKSLDGFRDWLVRRLTGS